MLGTGTVNLQIHVLTIASYFNASHMSNGRMILTDLRSLISDMEAFETLSKNRNEMFLESISQILKNLEIKSPYQIKGKYWKISTKKTFDRIFQWTFSKPLQNQIQKLYVYIK